MDNETTAALNIVAGRLNRLEKIVNVTGAVPVSDSKADAVAPVQAVAAGPNPAYGKRAISWGRRCQELGIIDSLLWIEKQIGLKPECLVPCMKFESNLNPAAKNPHSTATGFIQFMAATAARLGTTVEALAKMTPNRQMSYVYKYFVDFSKRGFLLASWTVSDTYGAILWPAMIGKPDTYRVFVNDPAQPRDAYDVNKGLDFDKDGFITKAEACKRVNELHDEGLLEANVAYI